MKSYTVFNVDQVEGLPESYYKSAEPIFETANREATAEAFLAATEADVRHGGNKACYAVDSDYVQMPPIETFESLEAYFATLGHEITHCNRHPKRLDRSFSRKRWGEEGYAQEELVAELGAAFLAVDLGLSPEPRDEHTAYIAHWPEGLQNEKRLIFQAAAHAQKVVDHLHGLQANSDEVAA